MGVVNMLDHFLANNIELEEYITTNAVTPHFKLFTSFDREVWHSGRQQPLVLGILAPSAVSRRMS